MTEIKLDFKNNIISKHKPLFERIKGNTNCSNFVLYGGRASFKTYDTSAAIVCDLLMHARQGEIMNAVVFMNKREEIRDGVRQSFENVIDNLGLSDLFTFRLNPMDIKFVNGSTITFYGLNGQEGKKGNAIKDIGWIWFEEFDQFRDPQSIEAVLDSFERNAIKGESVKKVYTFNPPKSRHHWVFDYVNKLDDACVIHTTYLDDDTGHHLINNDMLKRINNAKENDYAWYSWNYLGIIPSDAETDFPSLVKPEDGDEKLDEHDYIFAGIDSATKGKDSTVLCLLAYNELTKKIKLIGFQKFDDIWVDGYTSMAIGEEIAIQLRRVNCNAVYVDPMQGQHIIDYMLVNAPEITTQAVNFGSAASGFASGKTRLAINRRAEMYLNASEQLRSKRIIALGDALELEKQLDATDLIADSRNIKVVPKDVIKARIGHSPDEADSFVLAIQAIYETMRL